MVSEENTQNIAFVEGNAALAGAVAKIIIRVRGWGRWGGAKAKD